VPEMSPTVSARYVARSVASTKSRDDWPPAPATGTASAYDRRASWRKSDSVSLARSRRARAVASLLPRSSRSRSARADSTWYRTVR